MNISTSHEPKTFSVELTQEKIILIAHGLDQLAELMPSFSPFIALQDEWGKLLKRTMIEKP